jgi:hypothetical protein
VVVGLRGFRHARIVQCDSEYFPADPRRSQFEIAQRPRTIYFNNANTVADLVHNRSFAESQRAQSDHDLVAVIAYAQGVPPFRLEVEYDVFGVVGGVILEDSDRISSHERPRKGRRVIEPQVCPPSDDCVAHYEIKEGLPVAFD